MGLIPNPKLIFHIVLFLISFDYYEYNMIYHCLIRVFIHVRPSSIEDIMNWRYFTIPRLWIDVELNSNDEVDLVLLLHSIEWCH